MKNTTDSPERFTASDLFAVGEDVMFEFSGGPFDGMKVMKDEWPKDRAWPGTEILDKPTGSLYRYHKDRSVHHAVYTYRAADSANETSPSVGATE